ncbi:MAG: FtsW/RodA/SpoVE family cell cycle protein, partial [Rhodobiaceae bacterium]
IIFCFGFLVWRALWALREERDHWVQLSAAGLTCLFGLQAVINLAVNLNLMPSKGMTLPFVSYGGSSLLGSALTMGMLAALLRRRINGPAPLQSPRAQPMAAVSGGGAL